MTNPMKTVARNLPAPTSAVNVTARLLLVAASQIGYREGRDSSGWNNDNAFGKWYGTNGVSWCAQFVSWAAFVAGIPESVIPRHQYTPAGWNWFVAHGRAVDSPRAGDILYVDGYVPGEGNRVHHVGIVEKVLSNGLIQTIEGNTNTTGSSQGNGVYRLKRTVTSKLRFARPNYAAAIAEMSTPSKPPVKPTPPPATKPVQPTVPEDDMPYTKDELKQIAYDAAYAADKKYGGDLWAAPTGTGTHFIATTKAQLATLTTQVAGLTAAVQAMAEAKDIDPAQIVAAVEAAAEKALADVKITLAVEPTDATLATDTTPEA